MKLLYKIKLKREISTHLIQNIQATYVNTKTVIEMGE